MKNKLNDFQKEKNKLKLLRIKEVIILLLMACISCIAFMIVFVYILMSINNL
jgi:predicted MFS family arabinose efflux permease